MITLLFGQAALERPARVMIIAIINSAKFTIKYDIARYFHKQLYTFMPVLTNKSLFNRFLMIICLDQNYSSLQYSVLHNRIPSTIINITMSQQQQNEREHTFSHNHSQSNLSTSRSSQPQDLSLASLNLRLEEAQQAIYEELALKRDPEKAYQLLEKYEEMAEILSQIRQEEEQVASLQENEIIKAAYDESVQLRSDTKLLEEKLRGRLQLRQIQEEALVELIKLVKVLTINARQAELTAKQTRLIQKSLVHLAKINETLHIRQNQESMFRRLKLTDEKQDDHYVLNLIRRDAQRQLREAKEKGEILKQKVSQTKVQNQVLNKQYLSALEKFNQRKKRQLLLAVQPEPKPRKVQIDQKERKSVQTKKDNTITPFEPIPTQILVLKRDWKYEISVGVILTVASILLLLKLI